MNTSPSPSFFKSLCCLIAIIIFPIITALWAIKCMVKDRPERLGFEMLCALGFAEICGMVLHFQNPAFASGIKFVLICIAYVVTWFATLLYLGRVKDTLKV